MRFVLVTKISKMKAYLKNGKTIRISQEAANKIAEMKVKETNPEGNQILTAKKAFNKNLMFLIDVEEVIAIR